MLILSVSTVICVPCLPEEELSFLRYLPIDINVTSVTMQGHAFESFVFIFMFIVLASVLCVICLPCHTVSGNGIGAEIWNA